MAEKLKITVAMKVISKPKRGTRCILKMPGGSKNTLFYTGNGNIDLVCGKCATILCNGIKFIDIPQVVILCPACNKYNEPIRLDNMELINVEDGQYLLKVLD